MIKLNKLHFVGAALIALTSTICAVTYAQSILTPEAKATNEHSSNIIKKNLEAREDDVEIIERIIIEGVRDPENLPKKKKTVEQKIDAALNPKGSLPDPAPIGYTIQCVKNCRGPACCFWEPGPRSYLNPDSVHR